MSSHRRFVTSDASGAYPPVGEYGFFDITTDAAAEQDDPSISGWLDYVWGGYEKEDLAATAETACGTVNGEPIEGCAEYLIEQRNQDRMNDDTLPDWDFMKPDDPDLLPGKDIPWDKIALAAGILVGGFIVYDKFIRPSFAKAVSSKPDETK